MNINSERLLKHLNELKEITVTPGNGVTRFSYSEGDAKAREYIFAKAKEKGCKVTEDPVGNVRIGLPSNSPDKKTIISGSHIDTVKNGGWLDGIYGTMSAIEVLFRLAEENVNGKYNYEAVFFAEEEGSNFGSTMTGSKFITGIYTDSDLDKLTDDEGRSLRRILNIPNNNKLSPSQVLWNYDDFAYMYELHIEQGPVLDKIGTPVGIVRSICGMRVIEVTVEGVGNHAGATPMADRFDALCTASECVLSAEKLVREESVVTVGKMEIEPNCSNVIPERVIFSLEVRDSDEDIINDTMDKIIESIKEIGSARGCNISIKEHSSSRPIYLDKDVMAFTESVAKEKGIEYRVMPSGAVHDAAILAPHIPTGMIFVPSINGRSHVPEENTDEKDLITGAQLLMDVVYMRITG